MKIFLVLGQALSVVPMTQVIFLRAGVAAIIVGTSLFIILSKRYGPKEKHWAYATVGTVMGYLLKD